MKVGILSLISVIIIITVTTELSGIRPPSIANIYKQYVIKVDSR